MIALGILCFAYFLILLIKRVDFGVIWLLAAVCFAAVGSYLSYCSKYPAGFRIPAPLMVTLGIAAAAGLALFLVVEGLILRTMLEKPKQNLEYVIVLGAQVRGKTPSRALLRRLEAAEEYLKENPETIAVLSGGQGDGEDITEAQCMYEYLTAHGIEGDRLLKEERSTSTQENLQFSAEVIGTKEASVGILSNNFHVYRAKLLAQKQGYMQVHGISAKSDWRLQVHYLVREFFALIKEKLIGNI